MTADEFNALPLLARQYIEQKQGCMSCGKSQDIDTLYKNYLIMSKKALFTLRMGAVSYITKAGKGGVLYPIHPNDSEVVVKEKLETALAVYAIVPGKFSDIQEEKIEKILGAKVKPLTGAAKIAAEKKAAKEQAEADAAAQAEADAAAQAEADAAADELE